MKNLKLFVAIILSLALALSLIGCRAAAPGSDPALNGGEVTEFPTEPPTEATTDKFPINEGVPDITLDPNEPQGPVVIGGDEPGEVDQEMKTLRVQDIDQSVLESLIYELSESSLGDVPMAHLRDQAALANLLERIGSGYLEEECQIYDETFFATHDLLIIPRVTNTGSARHTAQVFYDGHSVCVQLSVEVPEIATMDMANWCLVLAVPKVSADGGEAVAMMTGGMSQIIQQPIGGVGR